MRLNLVHYYRNVCGGGGYSACHGQHTGTAAFATMSKAQEAADAFSEGDQYANAVAIEAPDPFTLRELELIVAGCDAIGRMMQSDAFIAEEMRELRCKAASYAFNEVTGL
jgi:hypothetical protein